LVSVTACGAVVVPTATLPKLREDGFSVTVGGTPTPVRLTVCGLFAALSVRTSDAVRVPPVVGAKVTLIVQVAEAATVPRQLVVCEKSLGFAPPTGTLVTVSGPGPLLVSVTV
jgi:hypothetical protein